MGEVISAHVAQAAGGSFLSMVPLIVIVVAVWWFLVIRPQRKRDDDHKGLISELKKGDEVILTSGFYAKVLSVDEKAVTVDLGDKSKVKVLKSAVYTLANPANGGKSGDEEKATGGETTSAAVPPMKASKKQKKTA